MSSSKIRVNPVSIEKVKVNFSMKNKNTNTIDGLHLKTTSIESFKYRLNNNEKDFENKNIANDLEN